MAITTNCNVEQGKQSYKQSFWYEIQHMHIFQKSLCLFSFFYYNVLRKHKLTQSY